MPSDFEVKVGKNYDAAKALQDSLTPISTGVKTHASNYDNACKMYYASEDQIGELKDKIKQEQSKGAANGGAAVLKKLQEELKKWEGNHPQLAQRVKKEHAECEKLRTGVTMADKAHSTISGAHKTLQGGAARAVMTNVNDTQADLKLTGEMLTKAEKEITRLDKVLTECMPFPKSIK